MELQLLTCDVHSCTVRSAVKERKRERKNNEQNWQERKKKKANNNNMEEEEKKSHNLLSHQFLVEGLTCNTFTPLSQIFPLFLVSESLGYSLHFLNVVYFRLPVFKVSCLFLVQI